MKRDFPDRPIVGVGAVIVRDHQVVLVRRGGEPLKGKWSLPGGAVELGETLRQAAAREALEETGLKVEVGEVLEVLDSIVPASEPSPEARPQYHYVLVDLLCVPREGELRAGGDALEARWVESGDLSQYQLSEAALRIIHKALDSLSKQ